MLRKLESILVLLVVFIFGLVSVAVWQSKENEQQPACSHETIAPNCKKEDRESIWKWTTNDPAAFYTAVLALVAFGQAVLFVWQLLYMRKGMDDTRIAANAARDAAIAATDQAKTARDEFNSTHRPKLIVTTFRLLNPLVLQQSPEVEFVYVNIGETCALEITLVGEVYVSHDESLVPRVPDRTPWAVTKQALACGGVGTAKIAGKSEMDEWIRKLIEGGQAEIYCVGVFTYLDSRGVQRRSGFARRYEAKSGRFVTINDPEYEYSY